MEDEKVSWLFFTPNEIQVHQFSHLSLPQLIKLALSSKLALERIKDLFGFSLPQLNHLYKHISKYYTFLKSVPCGALFYGLPSNAEMRTAFLDLITANNVPILGGINTLNLLGFDPHLLVIKERFSNEDIQLCERTNPLLLFKLLRECDGVLRGIVNLPERNHYINLIRLLVICGLLSAPHSIFMWYFLRDYFLVNKLEQEFFKVMGQGRLLLNKRYLTHPIQDNVRHLLKCMSMKTLLNLGPYALLVVYRSLPQFISNGMQVDDIEYIKNLLGVERWEIMAFSCLPAKDNWQIYRHEYFAGVDYLIKAIHFMGWQMSIHSLVSMVTDGSAIGNQILARLSDSNYTVYEKFRLINKMIKTLEVPTKTRLQFDPRIKMTYQQLQLVIEEPHNHSGRKLLSASA